MLRESGVRGIRVNNHKSYGSFACFCRHNRSVSYSYLPITYLADVSLRFQQLRKDVMVSSTISSPILQPLGS